MVLSNGCGSRALVLLGARQSAFPSSSWSWLAIFAQMTLKGLIAPGGGSRLGPPPRRPP